MTFIAEIRTANGVLPPIEAQNKPIVTPQNNLLVNIVGGRQSVVYAAGYWQSFTLKIKDGEYDLHSV